MNFFIGFLCGCVVMAVIAMVVTVLIMEDIERGE